MRLLEEHNPDVSFDWARLLKAGSQGSQGSPGSPGASGSPGSAGSGSPGSAGWREERRQRRERRDQRPRSESRPAPATSAAAVDRPPAHPESAAAEDTITAYPESEEQIAEGAEDTEDRGASDFGDDLSAEPREPYDREASGEPAEPEEPEPGEPEPGEPVEPEEPVRAEGLDPTPPAVEVPERYARLGADGLSRLRARYADLVARLAAKELEDEQRADLAGRAERLNPDGWQTAGEVAAALEDYESVFESLRAVLGRQPRRRL
jgi:hypothetical protein